MKKIKVQKEILRKEKDIPFMWGDLKHIQFEDDDVIEIGYNEGYYSENNSWDAHYFAIVTRMVEETDEQFAERQKIMEQKRKIAKQHRYETYLTLKKEFENGKTI